MLARFAIFGAAEPRDKCGPKDWLGEQSAHRGTFSSTQLFHLLIDVTDQFDMLPGDYRIREDDLYGLSVFLTEARNQVRVAFGHCAHRIMQPGNIKGAGESKRQLHRVHVVFGGISGGFRESGLE
ncbi:Uncharacterised protein [Mycobacteroides abscessus]|nr:Uncharacterised protein [Mycobacteroides abscessus]CPU63306.1 Uncharacterised protein [Mycobacteroides abscessus]SLD06215.1 Uncharacterised protein [Mycobacteroides abscessus subsp. massiliense]